MNAKALAVALMLWSTAASAETLEQRCAAVASLTEEIATLHQNQAPLAGVLEALADNEALTMTQKLVVMIYEQPRYHTEENQKRFINEWRDRIHVWCLTP